MNDYNSFINYYNYNSLFMNHNTYEMNLFNLIPCIQNDTHVSYLNNSHAILVTDIEKELKTQLLTLSLCMQYLLCLIKEGIKENSLVLAQLLGKVMLSTSLLEDCILLWDILS